MGWKVEVEISEDQVADVVRNAIAAFLGSGGGGHELIAIQVRRHLQVLLEGPELAARIKTETERLIGSVVFDVVGEALARRVKQELTRQVKLGEVAPLFRGVRGERASD